MIFMIWNRLSCCRLFLLFLPVQMQPYPQLYKTVKAALKAVKSDKHRLNTVRKKHSAFLFCSSLSQTHIILCRRILGRSSIYFICTGLWSFRYNSINHIILIILQTAHSTVCQEYRQLIIAYNQTVVLRIAILSNLAHSRQIASWAYGTSSCRHAIRRGGWCRFLSFFGFGFCGFYVLLISGNCRSPLFRHQPLPCLQKHSSQRYHCPS